MKNSTLCLLSALGGALVGAMVTALVTPQSGKELRNKIGNAMSEAKEKFMHQHDGECRCGCDE